MSEITVTLRDEQRAIHSRVHGSAAARLVAALSADPETIEELAAALHRFQAGASGETIFGDWQPGDCDSSWDAGVCIIDLAARLVAADSSYFTPEHLGCLAYHDGQSATDVTVRYHLADQWQLTDCLKGWKRQAQERRQQLATQPRLDSRAVLFGTFCDYAVDQCLEHATGSSENPIALIHRQWLMTPRGDLGDRTPRQVLLADQHHLDMDLQHREQQWSLTGKCPPGIPKDAAAYRFAGIGTHEWALHYEFVRFVLQECWSAVQQRPSLRAAEEKHRLEREVKTWFQSTQPDMQGFSPVQIIQRERRRIPLAVSATEAVIDHDCPLCQMMLDSSSPFFWHLDGCNMDDDWEFSRFLTREEWQHEQRQFEEFSRHFNASMEQRRREALAGGDRPMAHDWQGNDPSALSTGPLELDLALFRIGACLAELNSDLKNHDDTAPLVATLNRDFGNLRETVSNALELVEPVVTRFCEDLDTVCQQCPTLTDRCADLQEILLLFCERITC